MLFKEIFKEIFRCVKDGFLSLIHEEDFIYFICTSIIWVMFVLLMFI